MSTRWQYKQLNKALVILRLFLLAKIYKCYKQSFMKFLENVAHEPKNS